MVQVRALAESLVAAAGLLAVLLLGGCHEQDKAVMKKLTGSVLEGGAKALEKGEEYEPLAKAGRIVEIGARAMQGLELWEQSEPLRDRERLCSCTIKIYDGIRDALANRDHCIASAGTNLCPTIRECIYGSSFDAIVHLCEQEVCKQVEGLSDAQARAGIQAAARIQAAVARQCKKESTGHPGDGE